MLTDADIQGFLWKLGDAARDAVGLNGAHIRLFDGYTRLRSVMADEAVLKALADSRVGEYSETRSAFQAVGKAALAAIGKSSPKMMFVAGFDVLRNTLEVPRVANAITRSRP